MRQRRDGPFRIINGLLEAAHFHRHFGVEICPPFGQLQGE